MDNRLRRIFESLFNIPSHEWSDRLSPEHIQQWDSLGHLSLIQAIEAEFQLSLEDGSLTEMEDVAKIKDVLFRSGVTA